MVSARAAFILRLAAGVMWCRLEPKIMLVLQSSVPDGSLLLVSIEAAPVCPRVDYFFRGLHAGARWSIRSSAGTLTESIAKDLRKKYHRQLCPPAAFILMGRASWARQNIRVYPVLKDEWNSSALFLAVIPESDAPSVKAMLWNMWREQSVADLTALVPRLVDGQPRFEAHAVFPFADTTAQCGKGRDHPDTFRSWTIHITNETIPKELVFPRKFPPKLGGCLLPVNLQYDVNIFSPGYFIPEGYATAMLDALATFLDVKPQHIPAPPDQLDTTPGAPEWSWYDGLAALDSGVADVLVGQYMYIDWRYDRYAALGPHGVSYYRWYLPLPAPTFLPILPHLMLPQTVVVSVFASLCGAIVVVALAAVLLDASAWSSALSVCTLFVEQPITTPALNGLSFSARVVILTALVGFLNVNVVIKSAIVSSITSPQVDESLLCPADLLKLDSVVVGMESPITATLMEISDDPAVQRLRNHTEECYLNFTDCAQRLETFSVLDAKPFYCIVSSEEMISFSTAGRVQDTMYSFSMPLQRNMYGWYARKMFPLTDRANTLFLLLQQSGLQASWAETMSVNLTAMARWMGTPSPCEAGNTCAINLRRAYNLFVMLSLGLLVSMNAFVLEHAVSWLTNKKSFKHAPRRPRRKAALVWTHTYLE